jgi:uroporphyrinogen-III synthase
LRCTPPYPVNATKIGNKFFVLKAHGKLLCRIAYAKIFCLGESTLREVAAQLENDIEEEEEEEEAF